MKHRPAFTRNGLAWLVVGSYCAGWMAYGLGWFKVNIPVITESGQAGTADVTSNFLMSIIPLVTMVLIFFFRKGVPATASVTEKPVE